MNKHQGNEFLISGEAVRSLFGVFVERGKNCCGPSPISRNSSFKFDAMDISTCFVQLSLFSRHEQA